MMSSLQDVNPRVMGIRRSPHSLLQSLAARITQEISQVSVCEMHLIKLNLEEQQTRIDLI